MERGRTCFYRNRWLIEACRRKSKAESNSITNQRALLWDFIRNHEEFADCTVIEKCDDGYSGVHFDSRPQFAELIELAKAGKVNCIIVKDFSRFGRNYVELGDYLEQYFPFLGVRFISVNEPDVFYRNTTEEWMQPTQRTGETLSVRLAVLPQI